eukprot:10273513-Karenia_brevis.AAC.1
MKVKRKLKRRSGLPKSFVARGEYAAIPIDARAFAYGMSERLQQVREPKCLSCETRFKASCEFGMLMRSWPSTRNEFKISVDLCPRNTIIPSVLPGAQLIFQLELPKSVG